MAHSVETVPAVPAAEASSRLGPILRQILMVAPGAAMLAMMGSLAHPASRSAAKWMLAENRPVELFTFICLFSGGALGLALWRRMRARGMSGATSTFHFVFALGLLLTAMEEIAWGQQLLGFPTPGFLQDVNRQGETTFHNMPGLHCHTELLRIAFGLGGLIGIIMARRLGPELAVPRFLWPWFAIIAAHAGIDLYADLVSINRDVDFLFRYTSELVELLIGAAGLLYVVVHWKRQAARSVPASPGRPVTTSS